MHYTASATHKAVLHCKVYCTVGSTVLSGITLSGIRLEVVLHCQCYDTGWYYTVSDATMRGITLYRSRVGSRILQVFKFCKGFQTWYNATLHR